MIAQGFSQSPTERLVCRWHGHGLTVDVMPVDVRNFVSRQIASLLENPNIEDAVEGHLGGGGRSAKALLARLTEIARLTER
jgi:hypothetical protein